MESASEYIKARADIIYKRSLYAQYRKATQNMSADEKTNYIDGHVMDFIHQLMHHAEGRARDVSKHEEAKRQAMNSMHSSLEKLVKDYGNFRVGDPDSSPHIHHIAEHHDVVPQIINDMLHHKINIQEAEKYLLENIGLEKEHDPNDVSSSQFTKSMLYRKGVDVISDIGITGNALSMFRPSPPFLVDIFPTPDEEYVKLLVREKQMSDVQSNRVTIPKDSMSDLIRRLGIKDYRPGENPDVAPSTIAAEIVAKQLQEAAQEDQVSQEQAAQ